MYGCFLKIGYFATKKIKKITNIKKKSTTFVAIIFYKSKR